MTSPLKTGFLTGILIAVSFWLMAEDVPAITEEVPPPPIVSALSAQSDEGSVVLTWKPVSEIGGTSVLLRSDRPITAENYLSVQKIDELPHDVTTYRDTPDVSGELYYAVLSVDENGTPYDFFLPANNSLLVPVLVKSQTSDIPVSISDFDTITRNDAVIATWDSSRSGKDLVIYRSTRPFTGTDSLVSAIVVATIPDDGTPFVDYPVPGVPCYYAVLDESSIRAGTTQFVPGENTSRIPVEIPSRFSRVQRNVIPPLRSMPLPWLNPGNQPRIQPHTFSKKTEQMISRIVSISRTPAEIERIPYVFTMDAQNDSGGESLALHNILEQSFYSGKWETVIDELRKFLSIRRTPETVARARFYMGEARYFSGNYKDALLEFLLAQDEYYNQSREWIQYTLEKMVQ